MYPINGLLFAKELEDARRQAVAERRHRFMEPEVLERPARRERADVWLAIVDARRFAVSG